MYFLSLESSTKIFSLAVSKDAKVLRFRNIKTAQVLEDSIIPLIDQMLDAAGVPFTKLDAFAIALGPGSFTSLRVGLSTVKAFCMATAKPLVGICSMDVIAAGLPFKGCDEICVINDARRGNVYAALYGPQGLKGQYMLTKLDGLLAQVKGKTLFVGDALPLYRKEIEVAYKKCVNVKVVGCKALFADEKFWYPQAKVLAQLAHARLKNKNYDDAANVVPIYLYPQDCQVNK